MENPGGSATHLQISLPDKPPPPPKPITIILETGMASSDPAPLKDQNSIPAPMGNQHSTPSPGGDITPPTRHRFIMEHPGRPNRLQILLPDSPPLPANSTTNAPGNNMAFSNPAPVENQHSIPAPMGNQHSMPSPMGDQNSMPAPMGDQHSMPAPMEGQNFMSAPIENQHSIPAPSMPAPMEKQHSIPSPMEDQNSMKHAQLHQGLLESPMPNNAPLDAGGVSLQQGPDCLMPANAWWPADQDPSAGSEVPAPSQEINNDQMTAVQNAHSSLYQQIPVTNTGTRFICPSYLTAVPMMQQPPPIAMAFESVVVLEPPSPMGLPENQTFPPGLGPFSPTPQLLVPTPTQHAQGSEAHKEPGSLGVVTYGGNQPSFGVPVPSRDTRVYSVRTGLFEPNGVVFSNVDSIRPPPCPSPPHTSPHTSPPHTSPPHTSPPYGSPPCCIPQAASPGATPRLVEEVSDDAGAAVPLSPSTVASMNPLNIPTGQLPLPGGPELGSAPAIHVPQGQIIHVPHRPRAIQTAAAAVLERNRMPKPNAPAVILLVQGGACPTCKRDKPLPGERDMKTHIRCELPYRTTEGQVIMLRGYDPKLPNAFTIDGHGHKNGILMCPFCVNRVQVVCGDHPDDVYMPGCSTCRSFMQTGIAHVAHHLRRLRDPRQYIPNHHDTCPGPRRGCNCIPHYWRV
ncbi:unnamed protein product [Clonostachys byssicola]|uniref:Uncharacterized protein n=1 Tax=Clonostachys byssicola TaxID=160290 RepID=A0A9N9UFU8_9HYPO|nr:unnamed protein product [Clonostachys byssicola]